MLGMNLGLGFNPATGGASAAPATFTMTQLADAKRVYQRSASTGGGQSKGTGTIPVTVNASVAGTIYARCIAEDGSTVLQNWFLATTLVATGSQTAQISGVDARLGWFTLDLCGNAGVATVRTGTTLVGMGRVVAVSGQSLAVRMFGRQDGETATNATLSVSINANSSCYASYYDTNSNASPTWAVPADATQYNSVFCSEYLNRVVTAAGVNCALVGHSKGATSITAYIPAGAENAELRTRLDNVGGFEAFIWMQGHTDSSVGMAQATYQGHLDTLFTDITAHNAAKGSSYEKYITTMPNIGNDTWGTPPQRNALRAAGRAWAAANSGVSVDVMDIPLVADAIHESQAGAITLARHFYRASRPSLGLSHGDSGPTFTGSRSGATITLTPTFPSGGTTLSSAGTPNNRAVVSTTGGYGVMPVTSFTVNSGNIVIVLASTPAANDAIDISFDHYITAGANGSTDMIYDNGTDGETGMTVGRAINPTFRTPITVAAVTPSSGPTLTANGTPAYVAGATGFGNCMDSTSGFWASHSAAMGDGGVPVSDTMTVDCRFKIASAPGAPAAIWSGSYGYVYVGTDGKLTGTAGQGSFSAGATVVSDNAWHHLRVVWDGTATAKMYLDGVLYSSGGFQTNGALNTFQIGNLAGAFAWTGYLDEFATFTTALNSGNFTPPAAPWVGNETGIYSLYHLNSALTSG